DPFHEELAGKHAAGTLEQHGEDLELFGPEFDFLAADADAVGLKVHLDHAGLDQVAGASHVPRTAAEEGLDPDEKLLDVEGLGQVIVDADLESGDLLRHFAKDREDEDR